MASAAGATNTETTSVLTKTEIKPSTADMAAVSDDTKLPIAKENCANDTSENMASPDSSEAAMKKCEGSGDGKMVKPSKAAAAQSGKAGKAGDREAFVPAPPPATNAWSKRLQSQGSSSSLLPAATTNSTAPSTDAPASDKKSVAMNKPEQNVQSIPPKSPASVNSVASQSLSNSVVSGPHSQAPGDGPTSSPPGGTPKPVSEDGLPAKKSAELCNKSNSAGKPEKSEVLPPAKCTELRLEPGENTPSNSQPSCNEKAAGTGAGKMAPVDNETNSDAGIRTHAEVTDSADEQQSPSGGHVAKCDDKRRWEKNAAHPRGKNNNSNQAKATGLHDSKDWPSLQKSDKSPKRQPNKEVVSPDDSSEQSSSAGRNEATDKTTASPSAGGSHCVTPTDDQNSIENQARPLYDSGIEEPSTKDGATADGQSKPKKKGKGTKQKWLPVEIELPKTRRRRGGMSRPRTDSRGENQDVGKDARQDTPRGEGRSDSREGGRDGFARDGARRPPREGRGGHDRSSVGMRRNRRDPAQDRTDEDEGGSATLSTATTGDSQQTRPDRAGWHGNNAVATGPNATTQSSRMGYQGSRRAAHRGRGAANPFSGFGVGRGRYGQMWTPPQAQYPFMDLNFFDAQAQAQYQYYSVQSLDPTPTYFTPIVSQSDYYTSILADESAKKLIAQQIDYYFSTENLVKDFYLRRQMDNDGWIQVALLANFRRVRIHTGTVNVELIVDSMLNSKVVEISSDRQRMRARVDPAKWSLTGAEAKSFSSLSVDVPEFVPGKPFLLPTSPVDSLPPAGEFMPGKPFKFATPANTLPAADVPLAVASETVTSAGKTGDIGTSAKSENITDATECAAENKPASNQTSAVPCDAPASDPSSTTIQQSAESSTTAGSSNPKEPNANDADDLSSATPAASAEPSSTAASCDEK